MIGPRMTWPQGITLASLGAEVLGWRVNDASGVNHTDLVPAAQ